MLNQHPFHPAQLDDFDPVEVAHAELIFLIGRNDVYGLGVQGAIFTKIGNTLALEEADPDCIQCNWVLANQQSLIFRKISFVKMVSFPAVELSPEETQNI